MIYYYESIQRKVSREKSAWDEICEAQVSENPLSGATWIMLISVSVIACIERFGPEKLISDSGLYWELVHQHRLSKVDQHFRLPEGIQVLSI